MTGRDGNSCKIFFSSGDPFAAGQSLMNTMFHCVLTCNCVFTGGQRHIEVLSNFDDLLTTLDPCRLTTELTLIKHAIKQLSGGFTRCQQAWWEGFLECHCETKLRESVSDRLLPFLLSDLTKSGRLYSHRFYTQGCHASRHTSRVTTCDRSHSPALNTNEHVHQWHKQIQCFFFQQIKKYLV